MEGFSGWTKVTVLAGLACVGLLAGAAPAPAHETSFPSVVSLSPSATESGPNADTLWWGNVNSDKASCEVGRKVRVFRKMSGPDALVGSDKTDANGSWQFTVDGYPPPDGTYYAKVSARPLVNSARHRHTCARDRSTDLEVPGPDIDYDNDNYYIVHGDCDDNNPAVHPGATEVGNAIDDDCDGEVDEGVTNPNDLDNDNVEGASDNCPDVSNADQADADEDGKGNACDFCPSHPNPGNQPCPETQKSLSVRSR